MTHKIFNHESLFTRWKRRSKTIPIYCLLWLTSIATLPLTLSIAIITDLLRRKIVLSRILLFGVFFLTMEIAGILMLTGIFIAKPLRKKHYDNDNQRLQWWWGGSLWDGAKWLFKFNISVESESPPLKGPLLVLTRHASTVDTLLPIIFVSRRYQHKLSYVLKSELLADPCLDLAGQRLPNAFVKRRSSSPLAQIKKLEALGQEANKADNTGVAIFPEGTRYTAKKALAQRQSLSKRPRQLAQAEQLKHTLLPKPQGTMALLNAMPEANVLFLAHIGFDEVLDLSDILMGKLNKANVILNIKWVSKAERPTPEEIPEWLFAQWLEMDQWINTKKTGSE